MFKWLGYSNYKEKLCNKAKPANRMHNQTLGSNLCQKWPKRAQTRAGFRDTSQSSGFAEVSPSPFVLSVTEQQRNWDEHRCVDRIILYNSKTAFFKRGSYSSAFVRKRNKTSAEMQVRGDYNSEKTLAHKSRAEMNLSWAKRKKCKDKNQSLEPFKALLALTMQRKIKGEV